MKACWTGSSSVALPRLLDGRDLGAFGKDRQRETAGHRLAVEQHRAAAAQALAAALARAGERELPLQHFDQIVMRLDCRR